MSKSKCAKNTTFLNNFWELKGRQVYGAVERSTFTGENLRRHHILNPLLEVETSKKCRPLPRTAHFQVKILSNIPRPLFDVQVSVGVTDRQIDRYKDRCMDGKREREREIDRQTDR